MIWSQANIKWDYYVLSDYTKLLQWNFVRPTETLNNKCSILEVWYLFLICSSVVSFYCSEIDHFAKQESDLYIVSNTAVLEECPKSYHSYIYVSGALGELKTIFIIMTTVSTGIKWAPWKFFVDFMIHSAYMYWWCKDMNKFTTKITAGVSYVIETISLMLLEPHLSACQIYVFLSMSFSVRYVIHYTLYRFLGISYCMLMFGS